MKPTKRQLDELGRLVIPKDMREVLGVKYGDSMDITLSSDMSSIIIKKSVKSCVLCGNTENLQQFKDQAICDTCVSEIGEISQ